MSLLYLFACPVVRAYIYVVPFYHSWKEVGKARGTRNSEHTMRVVPTLVDSRGDRRGSRLLYRCNRRHNNARGSRGDRKDRALYTYAMDDIMTYPIHV